MKKLILVIVVLCFAVNCYANVSENTEFVSKPSKVIPSK